MNTKKGSKQKSNGQLSPGFLCLNIAVITRPQTMMLPSENLKPRQPKAQVRYAKVRFSGSVFQ